MKLTPLSQLARIECGLGYREWLMTRTLTFAAFCLGIVVRAGAFRAEVMPAEINQLPSNMESRQVEEMPDRLRCAFVQGPTKPDGRILEHIAGFFPAGESRKGLEHL